MRYFFLYAHPLEPQHHLTHKEERDWTPQKWRLGVLFGLKNIIMRDKIWVPKNKLGWSKNSLKNQKIRFFAVMLVLIHLDEI